MHLAIEAVFKSWNGKRAIDYRRQNRISDDLGTAVNVQSMVFGNRGDDSGTGVAFTRRPRARRSLRRLPGQRARGDVVAGIRNTLRLADLEHVDPTSYAQLRDVMHTLEQHYRDMCDIEFTIEKGRLWILQTRVGKRTAFGEWVMAYDMLEESLIDEAEALLVDANRLEELFKRRVDATGATPIAAGLNASPGAATGAVVFTADDAQARGQAGERVILVRRETTPDDYHGMIAAQGILPARAERTRTRPSSRAEKASRRFAAPTRPSSVWPTVSSTPTARSCVRATRSPSTASPVTCSSASFLFRSRCSSGPVRATPRPRETLEIVRTPDGGGRRTPPAEGAGERRYAGSVSERPRSRRRGDRLVPHRAHVPR